MEELENPLLYNVRNGYDQYTNYYVDDNCNVYQYTLNKLVPIKSYITKEGRPMVRIDLNGYKNNTFFAYRLLMKEYSGMSSKEFGKLVVDHIDSDPSNNHVSNLDITTAEDNIRRAWERNRFPHKEGEHCLKYSNELVESICKDIADGSLSRLDMRKKYGINGQLIDDIRAGRSHKMVSSKYVDQGFEYSDWDRPSREEKARIVCSYREQGYNAYQISKLTGFGYNFVYPVVNKVTFKYISDRYNI